MIPTITKIHIRLLNEGVETVKRVEAEKIADNLYRLLQPLDYDALDEEWEFLPGSIVRCEKVSERWAEPLLLATERMG